MHLQACEDCSTTGAVLKLLDSFEGLLERPALAADLRREHEALISELNADLKQVTSPVSQAHAVCVNPLVELAPMPDRRHGGCKHARHGDDMQVNVVLA